MTRYGFVVVGSSSAVGGFAGLSPKAASRSASKKPPSCVNDMRRVEGVEHHTLKPRRTPRRAVDGARFRGGGGGGVAGGATVVWGWRTLNPTSEGVSADLNIVGDVLGACRPDIMTSGSSGQGTPLLLTSEGVRSAPSASLNFFCFCGARPFSSFARAWASKTPTTSSSCARKVA